MKKIIVIAVLLFSFVSANSQALPGYTWIAQRYRWLAGLFNALGLPAGDGPAAFQTGQRQNAGAVYYDSTGVDAGLYAWTGLSWQLLGGNSINGIDDVLAFQQPLTAHRKIGVGGFNFTIDSAININLFSGLEYISSGIGSSLQMSDSVATFGSSSASDFSSIITSPTSIKFIAFDGAGSAGDVWTNLGDGKGHWAVPGGGSGTTWNGVFGGTTASGSTLSITCGGSVQWIFTGSSNATWTLPAFGSCGNRAYFIKNEGSDTVTVQRAGSDQLYTTVAVNSIDIAPGESRMIASGVTYWHVHNLPVSGGTWGSITGTLSAQTDLQTALDAKQNALRSVTVSSSTSLTLSTSNTYVFSGSSDATWTLPAGTVGLTYLIKSRGSAAVTLVGTLYTNTSVASLIILPGDAYNVQWDGTYYIVF